MAQLGMLKKIWFVTYRDRVRAGLERCRRCKVTRTDLTFGHIIPAASGASLTFTNATLLCPPCNTGQGARVWDFLSLAAEEYYAPSEQQWARLAQEQRAMETDSLESSAYHSVSNPVKHESAAQPEGSSTGGLSSPSQAVQSAESNDHLA